MARIKVYGADWCGLTRAARSHLDQLGVSYDYINIDQDRNAARWVADQNGGRETKPTIDVEGTILSEPSNSELDRALQASGIPGERSAGAP